MAAPLIEPVARLIDAFARLPGIGPKTAQRLTYHLLRAPDSEARTLAAALVDVRDKVVFCERCFNISESPVCSICLDPRRDQRRLCVVEEPLDVLALERTGSSRGSITSSTARSRRSTASDRTGSGSASCSPGPMRPNAAGAPFEEVIIATNPTLEGEATAMYLAERLEGSVGAITRIARGIPVGGDLEYADEVTLIRALQGRRAVRRMSNLVAEILLRLAKAAGAAVLGLILYLVLIGPFGATPSVELALLAWLSAAAFVILVETSPI